MEDELYRKVAERYLEMYETQFNPLVKYSCCNFRDIAANLVSGLRGLSKIIIKETDEETKRRMKKKFMLRLRGTKDYFKMLEEYPGFFEDEMSKFEGHFPDLLKVPARTLVALAVR